MQQTKLAAETAELLPDREALGSAFNINTVVQLNVPTVVNLGNGNCIFVPTQQLAHVGQSVG